MAMMRVCLFGRFNVSCDEGDVVGLDARRVQELLAYMLLHRGHPQPRERVADVLWGDVPAEQVRKGLRQTLWKLQSTLERSVPSVLQADGEFVAVDDRAPVWLDVAAFEEAHRGANGTPGSALDTMTAAALVAAVELYRGDLLEGWYNDWCLEERERLLSMYLSMLNKLTAYCAAHALYEAGLDYGQRALQHDRAHERTHRHLMRIYQLAGDRSGALRQYRQCVDALQEELGVEPAQRTVDLYDQIRMDRQVALPSCNASVRPTPPNADVLAGLVVQLAELRAGLAAVEGQLADYLERSLPEPSCTDRMGHRSAEPTSRSMVPDRPAAK
jgi:DNA-binding SARP family transcriptional activator